jgi:hypothetical protein
MPGFAVYHIGIHTAKTALMATEGEDDDEEADEIGDPVNAGEPEEGPTGKIIDEDAYEDE